MNRSRKHLQSPSIEWLERRLQFNAPGANYSLNFDDEFNGTTLDTTKWANYLPWTSGATGDNRYEGGSYSDYMVNADTTAGGVSLTSNLSVSGGQLHLKTQQTSSFTVGSQTFNYTGAMLTTAGKEPNYSSGYFEIRAQFPSGPKNWPAFWMTNGWPPEDDIMEYWPTHNSATTPRFHQGLYGMDNAWHDYNDETSASVPSANFHTFGLEWGPGYQKFYVDGTLAYTTTTGVPGSANPEYILLNSAVDASKPGTYSNSNNNTLNVDYVRIYSYASTPGPAIANSGFDAAGSYVLSGNAAYNVGANLGRTGTGDLHIYGGAGEADQTITGLAPNTSYTFNAYGEVGTGTLAGILGVKNYIGGAGDKSTSIGDPTQIVWLPASVTFTTGPTDTSAVIYLKNTGTGNINYDDLYFEKTPIITPVVDQSVPRSGTGNIAINTSNSSSAQGLAFSAVSDNPTLLPSSGLTFTGSGTGRTLQVTPAPGAAGSAHVTVTLTDQFGAVSTSTFLVTTALIISGDRDSANESDSIRLVRNGSFLDVYVNNNGTTPTEEYDYATVGPVGVNSLGGNDTVTIDASGGNPIPAGGLNVDLGTFTLGNTLAIVGTSDNNTNDTLAFGSGSLQLNGATITYANAQGINIDLGGGSDTLSGNAAAMSAHLGLNLNADTLTLAPGCVLPSSADVAMSGGALNVAQASQSIDAVAGNAGSSIQLGGATLSVGNANGSAIFAGAISGSGSLVKYGAGPWTLSGSGTFSGAAAVYSGTVTLSNANALGNSSSLSINNSAKVNLTSGLGTALKLTGLSIGASATLDVANDDVIIEYSGATILPAVQGLLWQGYAAGAWTGTGIRSSTAAGSASSGPAMAPGAMESSSVFSTFPATFSNQQVDATAVLIHYAIAGDNALNGVVNAIDFNALASNFGDSNQSWITGDFNYDGVVDSADFVILASNFGASVPASAVPQVAAPATPMLFSGQPISATDRFLDDVNVASASSMELL